MQQQYPSQSDINYFCQFAQDGKVNDVHMMIERCGKNILDARGGNVFYTALMYASYSGQTDVVALLIEKGADVNMTNEAHTRSALHLAAWKGHVDIVTMLIANGADVELQDHSKMTALDFAVKHERHGCLRILHEAVQKVQHQRQELAQQQETVVLHDTHTQQLKPLHPKITLKRKM